MILNPLYTDDYLMVIEKPPGLVVTSSETTSVLTLEDILKQDFHIKVERGGVVHRLDKDTSGLMVVAKRDQVLEDLQAQFKNREVKKEYLALVHGWVKEGGRVEGDIGRNPQNREKFVVFEPDEIEESEVNVKSAVTEYSPINLYQMSEEMVGQLYEEFNKIQLRKIQSSRYQQFSLLSCQPLTGRTHQIRVHLKHIGFPIVGDDKYGGRKTVRLDHRWCRRQFLHAHKLEFTHPGTKEVLTFESSLPADLALSLNYLDKVAQT